jgi:cyanophycinase-like exopeptidase
VAGTLLALIGSGETSPTMVTLHRELVAGLGVRDPRAVLLATPYAFQVNAADVSGRAQRYFARSVGLDVRVVAGTVPDAGGGFAPPMLASSGDAVRVRDADWVFAGPGNPSYALAHWRAGPVAAALRERLLARRGITVLASAAAATAGKRTVPVYEIYKAGGALRWLDGLDLLGAFGLDAAVIPHYDNAEGRGYDTRHCYLGEARLQVMENQLPDRVGVLGIDEHTALLIDPDDGAVQVRGRGGVTVRCHGRSTVLPSGCQLPLAVIGALLHDSAADSGRSLAQAIPRQHAADAEDAPATRGPVPLPELMAASRGDFDRAETGHDVDRMVAAILSMQDAVAAWDADTDEDQGAEQARALVRDMITRLGELARSILAADPAARLRRAVEPLLTLRSALRAEGRYAESDAIRTALTAAGLHIQDTSHGPRLRDE